MYNRVGIMGRLAQDPEVRRTQGGATMVTFTLAVDRDYKSQSSGERETDWIDCVAWRKTGEFISRYFTKGRMALVEGRLQVRKWTDNNGNPRRSTEVVVDDIYFADSPPSRTSAAPQAGPYASADRMPCAATSCAPAAPQTVPYVSPEFEELPEREELPF